MKKEKLKLDHIQIQSFVTSMDKTEKETIVAGVQVAAGSWLLSGCLTSLTCPAPDDMRDETPVRIVSRGAKPICNEIREKSRIFHELDTDCHYQTYKPGEK